MRLAPKNRSLNINTQKMVLLLEYGRRLVPTQVKGPAPLEAKKVVGGENFFVCAEIDYGRIMGFEQAILGPGCITLEYGVSAPHESFTLFIEGLTASSQLIKVPPSVSTDIPTMTFTRSQVANWLNPKQ